MQDRLPPNQQLVAAGKWPVVGERAPRQDTRPWTVTICGAVARETVLDLDELQALPQVQRVIDIHCVTRWSRLDVPVGGVLLADVLSLADVQPQAQFVSFIARSDRNHSTSLPLSWLQTVDAMLATTVDGVPLSQEHGGPLRMVVPGRYFYKSVKWLERIELLEHDRPGYWEAESGYHNRADPWREERFVAANVSKQLAARLIAERDFRGQDLLSIDCSDRDLDGLQAAGALLRNANFRGASLRGACFDNANLSGARLDGCDLTGATFRGADLEGVEFRGAKLCDADLSGASLFGASFCVFDPMPRDGAIVNSGTKIDAAALDELTDDQRQFVAAALKATA